MREYVQWVIDNWDVESYPAASDLWAIIPFAIVFPFVRFILDSYLYEPIGRHFIFKKAREISRQQPKNGLKEPLLKGEASKLNGTIPNGTAANGEAAVHTVPSVEAIDREALEKTHVKFKESCWKALYYTSAFSFAVAASRGEEWLHNPEFYFKGPGDLVWPDQTMKLRLKAMFLYIGGFYIYSIFALLFWETRRKDFGVSMVHHVVSVALCGFAYTFRFGRFACLVVLIHDTSDIFLEVAKLNKYLEFEAGANVFFLLFAVSWTWLRIWCYPRNILYASTYVAPKTVDHSEHVKDGPPLYYIFNIILILLFVLHVYWWILILRVVIKQIVAKEVADVRSEDEDEDSD